MATLTLKYIDAILESKILVVFCLIIEGGLGSPITLLAVYLLYYDITIDCPSPVFKGYKAEDYFTKLKGTIRRVRVVWR